VREGRFTRSQLDRNPEFTVNVPLGKADPKIVSLCGRKSGRDIDKIREAGLTPVEGETVSVPAIKEFPLTLECRVIYSQKQNLSVLGKEIRDPLYPQEIGSEAPGVNRDPHVTYFGEILNAYILED
jgi:flavin reductase (DIM6/NTAB) family NADH-FMN oxidoreductase RutF